MKYSVYIILAMLNFSWLYGRGADDFKYDTLSTSSGVLKATFIGHGTLMFEFNKLTIHIDPVSRYTDYGKMPRADIILITHEHGDHLDTNALSKTTTTATIMLISPSCESKVKGGVVIKNGEEKFLKGLTIKAIPAYNLVHKRENGKPYHPKGDGNGYVITFGDKRIYIAGDTENIPEMRLLKDIDWAFLPMNLPYTMTPEMAADAARSFKPRVLYPYHFGDTDTGELVRLLKNDEAIEVRLRSLK